MTVEGGCGAPIGTAIPQGIENRPGLSAIAYRMGTFATFREAIVQQLSRSPALVGLTTRVPDDYAITAIELWSAVADVLTFYQERIANEAFLRTAVQRDSLLRLVRLLGYQLGAGVAATAELAFTLEDGARAVIGERTRVQSVPAEGETAQTFETLMATTADARLNRLRVFGAPREVAPTAAGATEAISAPDVEARAAVAALAPGDQVILYAPSATEVLTVHGVGEHDERVTVRWVTAIAGTWFSSASHALDPDCRAYRLGRSFRCFGVDAPPTVVVADRVGTDPTKTFLTQAVTDYSLHGDGTDSATFSLDGRVSGLKPGASVLAVGIVGGVTIAVPCAIEALTERRVERTAKTATTPVKSIVAQTGTVTQVRLSALGGRSPSLLDGADVREVSVRELTGPPLRFWPYSYPGLVAGTDVWLPGRRTGWSTIEVGPVTLDVADVEAGRRLLLGDLTGSAPASATVASATLVAESLRIAPADGHEAALRAVGLDSASAVPLTVLLSEVRATGVRLHGGVQELSVTIGALPAQTLALALPPDKDLASGDVASALQLAIRAALPGGAAFERARVWAIGNALAVAPGVAGDRVAFGPGARDRDTVTALGLAAGQARFLDGILSAPPGPGGGTVPMRVSIGPEAPKEKPVRLATPTDVGLAEGLRDAFVGRLTTTLAGDGRVIALPAPAVHEPRAFLRLELDLATPLALDGASAVLHGNVAPASHGETVADEVLGDGDGGQSFQRFPLRKKPITYVLAARPGGAASSLRVMVDGVRWDERASLYGAAPDDRVYVTHIADDGTPSVRFGDGVTGARLPSGRQNVVARYRHGTGLFGRVRASTLTTLLDRPTGVRDVTNPRPADGGADPESLEHARDAAPGTVRTFNRAVSLRDFEDGALVAGEVAKAAAAWVWIGDRRAIHLTVAGQAGGTFSPDSLQHIADTLATERDPNHRLLVAGYARVPVVVEATVDVDDRHVAAEVRAAARAALLRWLSFDRRRFAEPVYLSEAFRVLQEVPGVRSVDVDRLDLKRSDPDFRMEHGVDPASGQPQPRLLMLPARAAGGHGGVLPADLAWVDVPTEDIVVRTTGGAGA